MRPSQNKIDCYQVWTSQLIFTKNFLPFDVRSLTLSSITSDLDSRYTYGVIYQVVMNWWWCWPWCYLKLKLISWNSYIAGVTFYFYFHAFILGWVTFLVWTVCLSYLHILSLLFAWQWGHKNCRLSLLDNLTIWSPFNFYRMRPILGAFWFND